MKPVKKILIASTCIATGLSLSFNIARAQCTVLGNAIADIVLQCSGGTSFRSGTAFNPLMNLYYSVNSGSSTYPLETYDINGALVNSVSSGFDFRGLWWNSALSQLEGNGFSNLGISQEQLNISGYPTGTTALLFSGQNQPAQHSCGQYDSTTNEIIYYNSGSIHRYSRATAAFLGSYPLNNVPVPLSDINTTSVLYTGCTGMEIGIYDFTNQRVYLFDKLTGNYVAQSQLPVSAPVPTNQRLSYANNRVFIYDINVSQWKSYRILDVSTGISNPASQNDISIRPGLSDGTIIIETGMLKREKIVLSILTVTGQVVYREVIYPEREKTILNLPSMAAGIYAAYLVTASASASSKIIIGR